MTIRHMNAEGQPVIAARAAERLGDGHAALREGLLEVDGETRR